MQALTLVCPELHELETASSMGLGFAQCAVLIHNSETQVCPAEAPAFILLFPQIIPNPDGAALPSKICQVTHDLLDITHILNDTFH